MSSLLRRQKNPRLSFVMINPNVGNRRWRVGWWLLACGVVGAPIDIAVFTVEGALRAGYSPVRDFNSFLSLGPYGWVNIVDFIVFGLLMTAFAVGVRLVLRDGPAVNTGPILLAVFGSSLVGAGAFVADPGPNAVTMHGAIHMATAIVGLAALTVAFFVFGSRYARLANGRLFAVYSRVTGVACALLFIATVLLVQAGIAGLLQRIEILVISTWIVLFALRLMGENTGAAGARHVQEPHGVGSSVHHVSHARIGIGAADGSPFSVHPQ